MSALLSQVEQALRGSGWLPREAPWNKESLANWKRGGNLLPAILRCWDAASGSPQRRAWLQQQVDQGAELALLPAAASKWIGWRLRWCKRPIPTGRWIGLASSRLGRQLDSQAAWFTVFRAACTKVDRRRELLVTAAATTTHRFVARASELFDVRVVCIDTPKRQTSLTTWLARLMRPDDAGDDVASLFLSPQIADESGREPVAARLQQHPLRDRAVVALSERLLVCHLRRHGHLEQLVRLRLADESFPPGSVLVALGEQLVDRPLADELLAQGAVGWLVLDTLAAAPAGVAALPAESDLPARRQVEEMFPREYLIHCTRGQPRGWPDQAERDRLDELILARGASDHSSLAALRRIVTQQRLVATATFIRGGTPVVSFTAAQLDELPQLRTYRPHLHRWDFEPYGICIDQRWLQSRGARPVQYGDETLWAAMPAADRAFFQREATRRSAAGREMDWRREKEWRHVGDVALHDLPPDAGLVFVPTAAEAHDLAPDCVWPITVLSQP